MFVLPLLQRQKGFVLENGLCSFIYYATGGSGTATWSPVSAPIFAAPGYGSTEETGSTDLTAS